MQNLRYYSETKSPENHRASLKNPPRSIDVQHREALTIPVMIAEIDHSITALDHSIQIEQQLARVNDKSHYAYPMSARAMETRRDNLKITRDALAKRLSNFAGSELNPAAAAA